MGKGSQFASGHKLKGCLFGLYSAKLYTILRPSPLPLPDRFNGKHAAFWHRIPGIDGQIEQGVLEPDRVGKHPRDIFGAVDLERNGLPQGAMQ